MVFYRKYRPQTLDDLIGQDSVKSAIIESFKADKLSHAYLFVGPRGTGKTSAARILAKMVNCEKPSTAPCNKCDTCLSITDGSNLDLIEIDAASNRGIDDVRTLRENIKLSPSGRGKKIYIIDEVHMLTTEAFNALLKTLEEPPAHVLFILATTEVAKVPATILSRVTRLDFKLAKVDDLVLTLEKIAKNEKIKIEKEALNLLAQKAEGSFRDGVKLLDQVASSGKLTTKDIVDGLSSSSFDSLEEILKAIAKRDAKIALLALNKQFEVGVSARELSLQLMKILRDLVLLKNGLTQLVDEKLNNLAEKFSMEDLVNLLDKIQTASEKQKYASIQSLPLELAIVASSSVLEAPLGTPQSESFSKSQNLATGKFFDKSPDTKNSPVASIASDSAVSSEPIVLVSKASPVPASNDALILEDKWTYILETIKPYNFSLEALLRSVKIQSVENGLIILEVPYSFHQRILEAPKSRDLLESVMSQVLEKPIKVTTVLGTRPHQIEDIANIEVAADDEVIRLASDIFNGKLVD